MADRPTQCIKKSALTQCLHKDDSIGRILDEMESDKSKRIAADLLDEKIPDRTVIQRIFSGHLSHDPFFSS